MGLRVEARDGTWGGVKAVLNFGAGDLLEIEGEGVSLMLPFTKKVVPLVDLPGGRLVAEACRPRWRRDDDDRQTLDESDPAMSSQTTRWRASVLTIFPEMFPGPLGSRSPARRSRPVSGALDTIDIRKFASSKHASVDDTPFGGGPGMVMRPDVIDAALDAALDGREGDLFQSPRPGAGPGAGARDRGATQGHAALRPL